VLPSFTNLKAFGRPGGPPDSPATAELAGKRRAVLRRAAAAGGRRGLVEAWRGRHRSLHSQI